MSKTYLKKPAIILLSILFYFLFSYSIASAADVGISSATVSQGAPFTATISVSNASNLFSANFDLSYNPSLVSFVSASKGTFLEQDGATTNLLTSNNSSTGSLMVGYSRQAVGGVPTGVNGNGTLMAITFNALAEGSVSLSFLNNSLCSASSGAGCAVIATNWSGGVITIGSSADITAPSIPTSLSASPVSIAQIDLSWSPSTDTVGVTGYRIYRSGALIATSDTNSYSNIGLTENTTYSYTVAAYDATGNVSAQSSSISATTQSTPVTSGDGGGGTYQAPSDTTAPTTPTSLIASVISSSQIDLSWKSSTDDTGVTGYLIYRGGIQIATSNTNSYSNTGLSPDTFYTYAVAAYDAAGHISSQSASVSATTKGIVSLVQPATPTIQQVQTTYQITSISQLATNTLVKSPSDPNVYVIKDGKKEHITSPEEFSRRGYKWDQIKTIQSDLLKQIADLKAQISQLREELKRAGTLIKNPNGPEVYVITSDGKKEHITSPEQFSQKGYRWDQIKTVTADEISQIPDFTSDKKVEGIYPNGTLIKAENDPTVYIIVNGKKRPIPDPATFNNWGLKWDQVKEVPSGTTADFSEITISSDIVRAQGNDKIYRIIGDKKLWIPTIQAFLGSGYKPNSEIDITQNELSDFEDVKYVKAKGGTYVYEIRGDKKYRITNTSQIPAQDIKPLTLAEFTAYPIGR